MKVDESFADDVHIRSSMRSWWEIVQPLSDRIPMPETVLLPFHGHKEVMAILDSKDCKIKREIEEDILLAGDSIGYPLFLRTDQTSCKHHWEDTCYVGAREDLLPHVRSLIEQSMCLGMGEVPTYGLAFRKFIKMDYKFKAFKGMPVSREYRFFADSGDVKCHHFYWVHDAIQFWGELRKKHTADWSKKLDALSKLPSEEQLLLKSYAQMISKELTKHIGGEWSIDFCRGKDGKWYFIDCAPAEVSWHPDHNPKKDEERYSLFDGVLE